jgi:hypothetical protein
MVFPNSCIQGIYRHSRTATRINVLGITYNSAHPHKSFIAYKYLTQTKLDECSNLDVVTSTNTVWIHRLDTFFQIDVNGHRYLKESKCYELDPFLL